MSYDLGKLLVKNKLYAKALFIFQKILIKKPNDLRANFQMGKIFYELNDLNKSILFFEKCNKIQPNTPNILFNLALILQSTGKVEKRAVFCSAAWRTTTWAGLSTRSGR